MLRPIIILCVVISIITFIAFSDLFYMLTPLGVLFPTVAVGLISSTIIILLYLILFELKKIREELSRRG
ncbi:hypothetical protein SAMN05421736_101678 [Evansella caseinilytica]|uniref:Uncharacterized protein n=1 Tax=Evansella caseinilytica TaxID=1503961 RepID=A0A1H3I0U6_9BACI|nr:hypothetical protein [Evansella caseinilytica]SDY21346.1 hypothetical protein SAMN05421736_101678 [Evansella caseinilytica]